MKERFKQLKIFDFIPFFVALGCGIATAIGYTVAFTNKAATAYVAIICSTLATLLFPLLFVFFNKRLPVALCVAVTFHLICAADLGTGLEFYDLLSWWDLFCHGLFGFNACLVAYYIIDTGRGVKLHPAFVFVLSACVTMALGALWEIAEYVTDRMFNADSQRVAESIAAGKSPVADTMEDLIITLIGCAVFAVMLWVDLLTKRKIFGFFKLLPQDDCSCVKNESGFCDKSEQSDTHAPSDSNDKSDLT